MLGTKDWSWETYWFAIYSAFCTVLEITDSTFAMNEELAELVTDCNVVRLEVIAFIAFSNIVFGDAMSDSIVYDCSRITST